MTVKDILQDQLSRYPALQIQDVYKLLYQSVMGSEHAVLSFEEAREWMAREIAEMGTGPDESLIDPISVDGQIVRVHLRPFTAQGYEPERLLTAFVRTANEYRGELQGLQVHWKKVSELQVFSSVEMENFTAYLSLQNYPAVHHSSEYTRLYRPAYRVVLNEFLDLD